MMLENAMTFDNSRGVDIVGTEPHMYKCSICGEELTQDYLYNRSPPVCADCTQEFVIQNIDRYFYDYIDEHQADFIKYMLDCLDNKEQFLAVKYALSKISIEYINEVKLCFCDNQDFIEYISERVN